MATTDIIHVCSHKEDFDPNPSATPSALKCTGTVSGKLAYCIPRYRNGNARITTARSGDVKTRLMVRLCLKIQQLCHLSIGSPLLKINHIITPFIFLLRNFWKYNTGKGFSSLLTHINIIINTTHNVQVIF